MFMVGSILPLFALTFGFAFPGFAKDGRPPLSQWTFVAFETRSWGKVLTSWTLLSDGSGGWSKSVELLGSVSGSTSREWHEIQIDEAAQREIATIFNSLPSPIPDSNACRNFMTDMPYGTIRLTTGAVTTEIAWNAGCMDPQYRAFLDQLKAADTLVAEAGKRAPIQRTEPENP
jgi:hypothetical protein